VEQHAKTKGGAEKRLRLALRDRMRVDSGAELTAESKVSVLAEAWFTEISTKDRSPSTLQAYRDRLDRQVLPGLGNLRVRELTTGLVDRHLRSVAAKHGAGTAKMVRSVLSGMCVLAARHDALERNVVRDAGSGAPTTPTKMPRSLTVAEARQLRALLTYDDQAMARDLLDFADMMLATGLRIGECAALLWHAVDLEAATVEVRGTVIRVKGSGLVIKESPKTKAGFRTLILPAWAAAMLRRRYARRTESSLGTPDVVFPAQLGGLRDPSNTNADLRNALDKAGFDWLTSHVFRKTAATLMDAAGLSARQAADQLGHSKPSLTQDIYFGRKARDTGAATALEVLSHQ
jgi:integrase